MYVMVNIHTLRKQLCHTSYADLAVAWSGLLIFDITVFLLTLWQSLHIRMAGNRNVTDILLRDGVFDHFLSAIYLCMECLGVLYFACVGIDKMIRRPLMKHLLSE